MNSCTDGVRARPGEGLGQSPALLMASRPALWNWITAQELGTLRETLARGRLPLDLSGKLERMTRGDLGQRFIEQNCRLFAALLLAANAGDFRAANGPERERLLRVLAYVRKDDDAIPDYQPEGFLDDQREVRAAMAELGGLLQAFKAWRLRHQVPGMWLDHGPAKSYV